MTDFGKILIGLGALLLIGGVIIFFLGRLNVPIGRLPGDFHWKSKSGNSEVYFPVVTCIVVSVLLSLIFWIVNNFRR